MFTYMVKSHEMDSLLKFMFSNPSGLLTCYFMYPQNLSMQNCERQYLVLHLLDPIQFPHCRGHSPTVADIYPTVTDIPTVADTFTFVVILG